jgi:hypothetical protein
MQVSRILRLPRTCAAYHSDHREHGGAGHQGLNRLHGITLHVCISPQSVRRTLTWINRAKAVTERQLSELVWYVRLARLRHAASRARPSLPQRASHEAS